MKKYEGILLCSDLDGTLIDSRGVLSEETQRAIGYFIENGGLFTLCTGRSALYLKKHYTHLLINAPLVLLNGAVVYDMKTDKVLWQNPMDHKKLVGFDSFLKKTEKNYDCVVFHAGTKSMDAKSADEAIGIFTENLKNPLYKAVFISPDEESSKMLRKEMQSWYGEDFFITHSWSVGIEILAKQSTKGSGVAKIRELYGDSIKKTVCVGDYENDISMIEYADIGYAVANATDEVKKAANRITASNKDSAIAKIISEL